MNTFRSVLRPRATLCRFGSHSGPSGKWYHITAPTPISTSLLRIHPWKSARIKWNEPGMTQDELLHQEQMLLEHAPLLIQAMIAACECGWQDR